MALRAFGVSLGVVTIGLTALLTAQAQTGPITIPLGPPGATTPPIIETAQFTELVINTASRNPTVPRAFMIIAGTADHEVTRHIVQRSSSSWTAAKQRSGPINSLRMATSSGSPGKSSCRR